MDHMCVCESFQNIYDLYIYMYMRKREVYLVFFFIFHINLSKNSQQFLL